MSYHIQLHPWCIIRCLPQAQTLIVARLRRRNEAEAHLQILQQLSPTAVYRIIFDVSQTDPNPAQTPLPDKVTVPHCKTDRQPQENNSCWS